MAAEPTETTPDQPPEEITLLDVFAEVCRLRGMLDAMLARTERTSS